MPLGQQCLGFGDKRRIKLKALRAHVLGGIVLCECHALFAVRDHLTRLVHYLVLNPMLLQRFSRHKYLLLDVVWTGVGGLHRGDTLLVLLNLLFVHLDLLQASTNNGK